MSPNLLLPFIDSLKEAPGETLALFLLLALSITALFARRSTLHYLWGLLRAVGRVLAAPVRFLIQYILLTHSRDEADGLPWISRRAPLTMANLSFVSAFTTFSGILLLAATLLVAARAFLPDARVGEEIRAIHFRQGTITQEPAMAQTLLAKMRAAGALDMMGRNGVYAEVSRAWIEVLKDEQRQMESEIEADPGAKTELAEAREFMSGVTSTDYFLQRMTNYNFTTKNPYYEFLIREDLMLNLRIENARNAGAPVMYDWMAGQHYQEMLGKWEATAKNDPGASLNGRLTHLQERNHLRWLPMIEALVGGLAFTWVWIWLCGLCVEFMNLLLGHFEWTKQTQEQTRPRN